MLTFAEPIPELTEVVEFFEQLAMTRKSAITRIRKMSAVGDRLAFSVDFEDEFIEDEFIAFPPIMRCSNLRDAAK